MATAGNVEDLKIKVGLKYTDPTKEYEFLDKLGEGCVPQEYLQETEHMMECKCDNIVGYDACFLVNQQLWIVMELCAGGSLNDLMKLAKSTLNEQQIAVCVRDILTALAYLHDNNRIHRDIKAGNVLLTSDGVSKLADFGVSGTLSKDTAQRHTVIGTPFWMAPEVIQETGHNYKADIWSLGITIIELAEGHPPLCNLHPLRAIFVIPSRPPPTFTDKTKWSDEMNDFLSLCLTKDPNQRPTARQLQEHRWLAKYKDSTGSVLTPLIQVADAFIKQHGGRDSALNALYDDDEEEDSESGSGSDSESSSGAGSEGGDTQPYGTMQIKPDEDDEYDDDGEYSTMKVKKSPAPKSSGGSTPSSGSKKKSGKKSKTRDEEEDYGTMKVVKENSGSDDDEESSSGSIEDMGTIQIKKAKKHRSSSKKKSPSSARKSKNESGASAGAGQASTVVVKKDLGAKLKEDRLGTLARGEAPKVRAVRQELEELDAAMVSKLQALSRQYMKDRELIASILAARKA